jgi:hypothetical protein
VGRFAPLHLHTFVQMLAPTREIVVAGRTPNHPCPITICAHVKPVRCGNRNADGTVWQALPHETCVSRRGCGEGSTPSTTRYPDGTRRTRTGRDGYDNSDAPTEMGVHSSEIVMGHRRAARPGTSNEGEAQRFFLLRPNRYVLMTYGLTTKHARHLHLANHRRSPHPPRTWSDPTAT